MSRYLIYECYVDEPAFQAHVNSAHVRALALEVGIPRLASRTGDFYRVIA